MKALNIKFHRYPPSGSRADTYGRMEKKPDVTKETGNFRERACKM
jgi:hypothetical protein